MTDVFVPPEGFVLDPLFSGRARPRTRAAEKRRARRRREQRFTPFVALSRRAQRARVVTLGWRIRTDPHGEGVFFSHDILPGSRERPDPTLRPTHYADVYFLAKGPQPTVYYNATLRTLASIWTQRLIALAEAAVEARLSPEDAERALPVAYTKPDGPFIEMVFAPPQGLASLDGLTVEGAQAAWLRAHWEERGTLVQVGEEATLDPSYRDGLGLDLVTNEPTLSVAAVVRAIAAFRARGEQAYVQAPEPFAAHQATVDALLLRQLWRWDCTQARAAGLPKPPLPTAAETTDGYDSNDIRL